MPDLDQETLSAFVDGDLDVAEMRRIEAELGLDPDLADGVEDLRALKGLAKEVRPDGPPRDLWPHIQARLEADGVIEKSGWAAWFERWLMPVWKPALTASMTAAVAVLFVVQPWTDPRAEEKAKANQQFQADLESARTAYLAAIQNLAQAAEAEADRLPPKTREKLAKSLATVDLAIQDCEAALKQAPNDPFGHETLVALYDEKIQVLRAALDAAGD